MNPHKETWCLPSLDSKFRLVQRPSRRCGPLSEGKAVPTGQRDWVLVLVLPITDLAAFVMLGEHLDSSEPQCPYL